MQMGGRLLSSQEAPAAMRMEAKEGASGIRERAADQHQRHGGQHRSNNRGEENQ